jgi:uncharacterized protein YqcC (DUF446 family)
MYLNNRSSLYGSMTKLTRIMFLLIYLLSMIGGSTNVVQASNISTAEELQEEHLNAQSSNSGADFVYYLPLFLGGTGEPSDNDPPTDILLSNNSTIENMPPDTVIGTFTTIDPNPEDTFTYKLVTGEGDTDNEKFNILGDKLRSSVVFDYETQNTFSIRVQSTDQGGLFYQKTFTIHVIDVNEPPIAYDQNVTTSEDEPISITLEAYDDDGDELSFLFVTLPQNGSLSSGGTSITEEATVLKLFDEVRGNPTVVYTPNPGFVGEDSFTFQASDGELLSNIATVMITVEPRLNNPPVAYDLSVNALINTPQAITLEAEDEDGDPLTWFRGEPANGSLSGILPNLTYTPDLDFVGTDSFIFWVSDGELESEKATVSITVHEVFEVTEVELVQSEDQETWTPVEGGLADGYLMLLDTQVEYYYLDVNSLISNRALDDGFYPFYIDTDSLTTAYYTYWEGRGVSEGSVGGWEELMWHIITAQAPMFYLEVDSGSTMLVDGLQYALGQGKQALRIEGDYWPGEYTFTGFVEDEYGFTDDLVVEITFNDIPFAESQSVTTDEDVPVEITLTAVDYYGDPLVYMIVDGPMHGELTGEAPELIYTPDADYYGSDSFTFQANDGTSDSNLATVNISVSPVLDPPTISADDLEAPFMVGRNQEFHVRLQNPDNGDEFTNVLARFRMVGATLDDIETFEYLETAVEPNEWRALPLSEDNGDLVGAFGPTDGFPMGVPYDATSSFRVTFKTEGLYPATIVLYDLTTDPETPLTEYSGMVQVLADFKVTEVELVQSEDQETWTPVEGSLADGYLMLLDTQVVYYYLDVTSLVATGLVADGFYPFYIDTDSLTTAYYTYWEGRGVSESSVGGWEELMWHIITAQAPMFYLEVDSGSTMLVDGLQYALGQGKQALRIEGDYWPGEYTFTGFVEDEYGFTDDLVVEITFNDIPFAESQSVTTDEDVPVEITLTAVDYYGDPLVYMIVDGPMHGELTGEAPELIYTPDADYYGSDSFTFQANDGTSDSNLATVNISVSPVNDPPVAYDQTVETDEGVPVEITLEAYDVDGDPLTWAIVSFPSNGTITTPSGLPDLVYTPFEGFSGIDSFKFNVSDGELVSNTATVTIIVRDTTPPVITITGATANGDPMEGTLEEGFILETSNDPAINHELQFADGSETDELLADDYFALKLVDSTVSADDLKAYYVDRNVPQPYLSYLMDAADGINPFVYIKGQADLSVMLVDAAQHDLGKTDMGMIVPDDFPVGTFTVEGEIEDLAGNKTLVTLILVIEWDEGAALAWVQANTELSSVSGTIADLMATFPESIPPVIVAEDYVIDSRITLAEALPEGTTVTIKRNGTTVLTDITLSGEGPFWFTELFDPAAERADFDENYGGAVEEYEITLDGAVPFDFSTTVYIESVISKDGYTTETVLADITLDAEIPADEGTALAWVQANTELSSVSGTIADLTATFPESIPPVIVAEDYVIDSRITLAEALPEGTTVTIKRNGTTVLTDITLSGEGPFWFTELFDPAAERADFDENYGGAVEEYEITLDGAVPFDFSTTVYIESVISKDGYTTETVLADITLDAEIPADEGTALAWVQANTELSSVSGTIADLTATFPESIPPVIVAEDYVIDSRITLAEALPGGTTVTIKRNGTTVLTDITLSGEGPFWFTELFDPAAERADFDENYGGAVEEYEITLDGAVPFDFSTTVYIESVISKDGYTTETVLADITLDAEIPADEGTALAWVQANTELSSVSGTIADLTATFPESIPPVIVAEDYVIDSRITLAEALPGGTTVTIKRNGTTVLTDITLSGEGPFWFTELFDPAAERADFDDNYGGAVEEYEITLDGAVPFDFSTTVYIESVISKDGYTTETVLADITLDAEIPADEGTALAWVQANMTLEGETLDDFTATFPDEIPPVLAEYTIDSRMTVYADLPEGSTMTITRTDNEGTPQTFTVDIPESPFWWTDLFPGVDPSPFIDSIYGGRVEAYSITINSGGGNTEPIDTTVLIESIISNDDFVSNFVVLDDLTLPVYLEADLDAALEEVIAGTSITGTLDNFTATFPQTIPQVVLDAEFYINSRITLSEALPTGTIVTIYKDGNKVFEGTLPDSPFWFTDLVEGSPTIFDDRYIGLTENYAIVVSDNEAAIDIEVTIESIISRDEFADELIVLAQETFVLYVPLNTLDGEIASAPFYVYDDGYSYVGDWVFDDVSNTYTATYAADEFDPGAMNDLARYLGALYRQEGSTIIEIEYKDVTYTWDETEPNKGSNWYAGETSLVSVIVADYLADPVAITITVSNGVHDADVTFTLVSN